MFVMSSHWHQRRAPARSMQATRSSSQPRISLSTLIVHAEVRRGGGRQL